MFEICRTTRFVTLRPADDVLTSISSSELANSTVPYKTDIEFSLNEVLLIFEAFDKIAFASLFLPFVISHRMPVG